MKSRIMLSIAVAAAMLLSVGMVTIVSAQDRDRDQDLDDRHAALVTRSVWLRPARAHMPSPWSVFCMPAGSVT